MNMEKRKRKLSNLIMVNINDIMLGNYIIQRDHKIIKVDSIYFDILENDKYLINGDELKLYDPIIITEDWLIEFDFHYDKNFDEWFENDDYTGFSISRDYENGRWICSNSIDISYLHELQNIFRIERKNNLSIVI